MTSPNVRHLNFLEETQVAGGPKFALNYLWMIVLAVGISGAAGGYALMQKHRITAMQEQLTKASEEVTQLRAQQLQKQQANLSVATRKAVIGEPVLWSTLLKKMAQQVPGTVTLNQISGTIANKRTLVLKGFSPFVLPIFRLKDNFAEFKECTQPTLVSIEQAQLSTGEEQLSFQLECTLT